MGALLRVALVTAYDGTSFRGWADVRDVALRPALERVLGQPIHIEAASRTDAGVHARGQVCAFDVERAGMPPDESPLAGGPFLNGPHFREMHFPHGCGN